MIQQIEAVVPAHVERGVVVIPPAEWDNVRSVVEEGFGGAFNVQARWGTFAGRPGEGPRHAPYYALDIAADESHLDALIERITPLIRALVERYVQPLPGGPNEVPPANSVRAAIRHVMGAETDTDTNLPLAS
jgi:hypothetical protein